MRKLRKRVEKKVRLLMREVEERRTLALSYLIRNLFEARSLDECLDVAIKGLSMLDFFQCQINLLEDGYFVVKRNHMDKKYQLLLEKIWRRKFLGHKIDVRSPFISHLLDSKIVTTAEIKDTVKVKLEDVIREYLPKEWSASKRLGIVRRVVSVLPKKIDLLILPLNYRGKVIGGLGISKTSLEHGDVLVLQNLCELFAQAFEKVQTREDLRKSEECFRKIFEEGPLGMAVVGLDYGLVKVNRSFCEMLGYTEEELTGLTFPEITHPDDVDMDVQYAQRVFRGEIPYYKIDKRYIKKNKEVLWATLTASVIRDDNGKALYGLGMIEDITERKKTEEALRRSEAQARRLLEFQNKVIDTATVWINLLDREGNVTLWNRAAELISGYPREKAIGNPKIWEWLYPDPKYRAKIFAQAKKIIEEGERVENYETTIRCKDATLKTISWYSNNILDQNGKLVGSIAVGVDITEIKKAQEKVRESEEKYRNLFENARDVIVTFDLKGNVTSINKAVAEYGLKEDEVIGKKMLKFAPKKYWPRLLKELAKIARGNPIEGEIELITPKGKVMAEYRSNPIRRGKKVVGLQTILRDITERKKMEEELRKYAEHLEELVEERTQELREAERLAAIGKTAAMVGHDLRNPLQAIVNTLYLAKKKLESMTPLERQGLKGVLKALEEQVEYMNKIVSDLQDYARPVKPEPLPTSLPQLINDAISTITVPENVKVSMVIPEGFPRLMVDPPMMKRVFTNLVTNALQAMPDGGQLTIRSSKKGETALISFQDTGVGIPEEDLPKLFQPLFTTKPKGQGFGLPVCRRLVEAHHGSITVESGVGRGSTFTVKIPLRRG